jgi:AraC-like DNA-binding protein
MAEAIVVRFTEDFVGEKFFKLPETHAIHLLFERATRGLKLVEPLKGHIARKLLALMEKDGFERLISLLEILQTIARSQAMQTISPSYVPDQVLIKNKQRLGKVIAYLIEHFTEPVSLSHIAGLASMNEAAFCRFFKSQTGQTMMQYLTDLRIRYACELLGKDEESVTQICFLAGFENVSHLFRLLKSTAARHHWNSEKEC